jgi:hypothetical protein
MNPHHTTPNAPAPIEVGEIKAAPRNDPHYEALMASLAGQVYELPSLTLRISIDIRWKVYRCYIYPQSGGYYTFEAGKLVASVNIITTSK